jgi:hypothetical protein
MPTSGRVLLAVDIGLKVATVGLLGLSLLFPDLPQFTGKAMQGRVVSYGLVMLVVPAIWYWRFRSRPYPVVIDILVTLPFFNDVLGNTLNLYDSVEWWDDLNHFVNWGLLTAGISLLLAEVRVDGQRLARWNRWALAFGFAAITAVYWELLEYVTFIHNSPELETAYTDTLFDEILGTTGGAIGAALVAWFVPPRSAGAGPEGGRPEAVLPDPS